MPSGGQAVNQRVEHSFRRSRTEFRQGGINVAPRWLYGLCIKAGALSVSLNTRWA
jgi:hypothetical protein